MFYVDTKYQFYFARNSDTHAHSLVYNTLRLFRSWGQSGGVFTLQQFPFLLDGEVYTCSVFSEIDVCMVYVVGFCVKLLYASGLFENSV